MTINIYFSLPKTIPCAPFLLIFLLTYLQSSYIPHTLDLVFSISFDLEAPFFFVSGKWYQLELSTNQTTLLFQLFMFSVFIREDSTVITNLKPQTVCESVCLKISPSKVYCCRSTSWLPLQQSWRWSRCVRSLPQSERTRC